jgi:altronate dehydratase large subunit
MTPAVRAYDRDDRPPGVRNHVLVLPSVICSRIVAERIADRVPAARAAPHDHGCGQIGPDREQIARTYEGVATNPNVAGVVVVGLGCEAVQSDDVATALSGRVPVRELSIQGVGGTDECVEQGVAAVEELGEVAGAASRRPADLSELTLGIVGSDATESTVETADPLVGDLARRVVEAGGRVAVAGVERLLPHREAAVAAAESGAADELDAALATHRGRPSRTRRVRREAAEHAFEAIAAEWAGLPIREVVEYGETATHEGGVAFVDAPAGFEEAATGLAAAGAQLVVHATADGIPTGHPIVPVIKVSGDPATVTALPEDIDVDATTATPEDMESHLLDVAGGDPASAERHGLEEFAITRIGPSV